MREPPLPPLALDRDHWRSRWLVLPRHDALHRVSSIAWEDGEMIAGLGTTVCGRQGRLSMPGILSRLGCPRCRKCCRALGVPAGRGAPRNVLEGEMGDA